MTWLTGLPAATPFEAVLEHRPELLAHFKHFYTTLWTDSGLPRRVLELCRLRIAAIHSCEAEWVIRDAEVLVDEARLVALRAGKFGDFTADEQAALGVAELMPYGHHQLTDEEVARLQETFGAAGAVALLTALAFFDVVCRLKCVIGIAPEARELAVPPLAAGSLP